MPEAPVRDQREHPGSFLEQIFSRKNLTTFCSILLILITSGLVISNKIDLRTAVNATSNESQSLFKLIQLVTNALHETRTEKKNGA
jgi:hypothetical protein